MAISGDLRLSAALGSYPGNSTRTSLPIPSKVDFGAFLEGRRDASEVTAGKLSRPGINGHIVRCHARRPFASGGGGGGGYKLSSSSISQEAESFLLNAINMSFFERLNLAWKIIFPSPTAVKKSNANIAKQRLQMILFSDRCAISDEAKEKIVSNIVSALSDFVEIESQDKVELNVSTDAALGTIYSVTVPVRRVRTEYQAEDEFGTITNIEYKDNGGISGSVDVKFDFYVPEE